MALDAMTAMEARDVEIEIKRREVRRGLRTALANSAEFRAVGQLRVSI